MTEQLAIDLDHFRGLIPAQKGPKTAWQPPAAADFAHGLIQAYDQTLNNTGCVLIRSSDAGVHLLAAQMIRPATDLKSVEGTYTRASEIAMGIERSRTGLAANADATVYERPAVRGRRTESSLIAGREIHRITRGRAVMVDNRHAKSVICGTADASKKDVKTAVERYLKPQTAMPWNEHIRDACLLALAYLWDARQQEAAAA